MKRLLVTGLCAWGLCAGLVAQEIYVSIPPMKYAAEQLFGEEVGVVLAAGQSPHSYSPTAKQISRLAQAKILFTTGVPFEARLVERLRQIAPDLRIVATDAELVKRTFSVELGHDHRTDCVHGDFDPHVWLSPKLYSQQALAMAVAMKELYPNKAQSITSNLHALNVELSNLDRELQGIFAGSKGFTGGTVMVYHPAFGYFCDAYGLKQIAVEVDGKEPTAAQLNQLMKLAREKNIKVVFVQKQFPASTAASIAESIGGAVIPLDPLSADYMNNLREVAFRILKGATE